MHGPNGQNVTIWRVTRCFVDIWQFFFEKMPKSPIFWRKMYNSDNSGWNWISVLPDHSITRHEHFLSNIGDFWLFLEFFSKNVQFLSGNTRVHKYIYYDWQSEHWPELTIHVNYPKENTFCNRSESSSLKFFSEAHLRIFLLIYTTKIYY